MATATDNLELEVRHAGRYRWAATCAAFARELRERRPTPGDRVSLLVRLVDRGDGEVAWLVRAVEVEAAAEVPPDGEDVSPYTEALVTAVAGLLGELPEDWFEFPGHHLPARVEVAALAVEKAG
jgi:hypothetical protein